MSDDLELEGSHADWLGGAFGAREEIKLPARCKELLQFALDNGILMDDTIPEDGVVLSKDEYKTLEDLFVGHGLLSGAQVRARVLQGDTHHDEVPVLLEL